MRDRESSPFARSRLRVVSPGGGESGQYVLYWMQSSRRFDHNHALDHALRCAGERRQPLVVYEGLRLDYPWASQRLHRFVLEGMRDNRAAARRLALNYWPFVETPETPARGLLARLAGRATVIVTDDFPCFIVPGQTAALAALARCPVVAVDGNGLVPLALLGTAVSSAAQLRRRLHRVFLDGWPHRAAARPRVPAAARASVDPPFTPTDLDDLDRLLARLPIDRAVPPVGDTPGGSRAARRRLDAFVSGPLHGYAAGRSAPAPPEQAHVSGLSPYLHFGHLSIEEVAARALGAEVGWSPAALRADAAGRRAGFFGASADVEAFIDEAITWRDVSFQWHWTRGGDAGNLERALPAWALETLRKHAADRRAYVYTPEEWEAGQTHDPLWNAAQRELVARGTIHPYLRMLWGKKVIEWSRDPDEAYRTLVHLNNKYALDGRDPNSWAGILWCFGLFDRPWPPERRVLGHVRYMSSASTARKFGLGPYLDYVAALPAISDLRTRGTSF